MKVTFITPEANRSNYGQANIYFEGRTRNCCTSLGWPVIRGERPIKISDSWFSTKIILVTRQICNFKVKQFLEKVIEY